MDKPTSEMPKAQPLRLRDALRDARMETAERSGVVIDLKDAEIARLELLNDALDPVFAEVPPSADCFDRGISRGERPRLWIDMVAHVAMDRDRRVYRFVQDTRSGARILAETPSADDMAREITRYVARRLVERERALATDTVPVREPRRARRGRAWRGLWPFLLGVAVGVAAVFVAAWLAANGL